MLIPEFEKVAEGYQLPVLTKGPITQEQIVRYAGANGDFNPMHIDPDIARGAGLKNTIVHGMFVMSTLGQLLTSWADIRSIKKFSVSFRNETYPGDSLTASGYVAEKCASNKSLIVKLKVVDQNNGLKVEGLATVQCQ